MSLSYFRFSVCLLRRTSACLFSRRFRERRDAAFRDAAVKKPVPRLHIVDVYTRNSGQITDFAKLNRLAGIIIAMNKQNLYIFFLMRDQSHRLLERLQMAINSFFRQSCEWRNVHKIICILRGYLIATTNEIIIREVYNL